MNLMEWDNLGLGKQKKVSGDSSSRAYWFRTQAGKLGFFIKFYEKVCIDIEEVRFKGAEVSVDKVAGYTRFCLCLNNGVDKEIFNSFCLKLSDIRWEGNDQKYADDVLRKTKQWMRFLQKENLKALDLKTQMGILGELKFIELLHKSRGLSYKSILEAWVGPERKEKDFIFQDFEVEVKAVSDEDALIQISNEKQLMLESLPLFLVCFKFRQDQNAEKLKDYVDFLREEIKSEDDSLAHIFDEKLLLEGYIDGFPYRTFYGLKSLEHKCYKVGDEGNFPAIVKRKINPGISQVKYKIDESFLAKFQCKFF